MSLFKKIYNMILAAGIIWVLFSGNAMAVDREVPEFYSTIQAAIEAADDGDRVLVNDHPDGAYTGAGNKNLTFDPEKTITVESVNGRQIIDCEDDGRGFIFNAGADSTVIGFTIQNGYTEDHGGGYLYQWRISAY